MSKHLLILLLCLGGGVALAPIGSSAQTLPAPAEFYFDEDRATTRPVAPIKGEGDALVDKLVKTLERDPGAWDPMLQLADIAMKGGRVELGRSLYEGAIAGLGTSRRRARQAHWNYAWHLHRAGDGQGALAHWIQAVDDGPVRGQWVPVTLALGLWSTGRKDEAVKWYAAAVRTDPGRWSSPENVAALLPDWSEADRAVLIDVQHAWAADPPRWP